MMGMTMEADSGEPAFIHAEPPRAMALIVPDNPVWHALTGPHRGHAIGNGRARHYPRDMAPFSAIAEPTEAAYADLAADLPANTEARLFRPGEEPVPRGWEELDWFPRLQVVASGIPDGGATVGWWLSPADSPAMMDLVAATRPGPF